ncbi:fibronectin type III domain-containing protein [Zobellia alginiliquefaciens]|uniref:fibronectin type III domain-containing protein n=1 Tax=Zobellia alginiliquefaciens TaxID=3032586 RepID=UPI0023E39572|nr:fibronectin type III domain-containing protein [Zobellia alginiliquefaciens]
MLTLALLSLVLSQSCSSDDVEDKLDQEIQQEEEQQQDETEEEETEETEDENASPTDFELSSSIAETTSIELDWSDATDPEKKAISYAVFLGDTEIVSSIDASEFTLTELTPNTAYDIKIVASDEEGLTSELITNIKTKEEASTTTATVSLGEANIAVNTPTLEEDFGTLVVPVKLIGENGEAITASERIKIKYQINSDVAFQYDYSIRTAMPVYIEEGESETAIKVEVKTDAMIELNDESFSIMIISVEGAELDETKSDATYIIAGPPEEDLPIASMNGPKVDITWSHPDAQVDAVLFKRTGETGQTYSSVGFYSTNEDSESFVLEGKSDGNYFLNIERRNDEIFGEIEVSVLITQPDGTRMYRTFLLTSNKDVVDFDVVNDEYTFEFQF